MLIHLRTRTAAAALTLLAVAGLLFLLPTSYLPSSPFSRRPPPPLTDVPPLPAEYAKLLPDLRLPRALEAHPLLHSRLHAFLLRPVRSYDAAVPINERKCPRELSDRLANPDQVHGDWEFWHDEVDEDVVRGKRVEMVKYLADVLERGEKVVWEEQGDEKAEQAEYIGETDPDIARRAPLPASRGFVSAAGNSDTTQRLLTLLRVLRKHYRVDLPFEVWTFPGEQSSESAEYRELTGELGATVHEARGLAKDEGAWKNFQIKGLAITSSAFREVIYLDSDNIPLRDPSHLFESPRYAEDGARAAFWPDLSKDHVDNAIWRIIGDECDFDYWTFESGQIVIDKVRRAPFHSCTPAHKPSVPGGKPRPQSSRAPPRRLHASRPRILVPPLRRGQGYLPLGVSRSRHPIRRVPHVGRPRRPEERV